jgi:uncharacterized protein YycO
MEDGSLLGALPFKGVVQRPKRSALGDVSYKTIEMAENSAREIYEHARAQLGKRYDWTAISGFVTRKDWQLDASWFCSELVFCSVKAGGVELVHEAKWRVSPRDLWLSALLEDCNE